MINLLKSMEGRSRFRNLLKGLILAVSINPPTRRELGHAILTVQRPLFCRWRKETDQRKFAALYTKAADVQPNCPRGSVAPAHGDMKPWNASMANFETAAFSVVRWTSPAHHLRAMTISRQFISPIGEIIAGQVSGEQNIRVSGSQVHSNREKLVSSLLCFQSDRTGAEFHCPPQVACGVIAKGRMTLGFLFYWDSGNFEAFGSKVPILSLPIIPMRAQNDSESSIPLPRI
jgi:hypothetical protein